MCAHDAVAADSHVDAGEALGKDTLEGEEIGGLFEDTQLAISTVNNVVNLAACTLSIFTGHKENLAGEVMNVKKKETVKFAKNFISRNSKSIKTCRSMTYSGDFLKKAPGAFSSHEI